MILIRLQKRSSGKTLSYNIVVKNQYNHITKSFFEKIGFYLPHKDSWGNKYIFINVDKFLYWIARGATLNKNLFILLKCSFPK